MKTDPIDDAVETAIAAVNAWPPDNRKGKPMKLIKRGKQRFRVDSYGKVYVEDSHGTLRKTGEVIDA